MKKDLLGLKDLSAENIKYILDTADTMKLILKQPNKKNAAPSRQNGGEFVLRKQHSHAPFV